MEVTGPFGDNSWLDMQLLMRALRDAGPTPAKEGFGVLGRPVADLTVEGLFMPLAFPDAKIGMTAHPTQNPPDGWTVIPVDLVALERVTDALNRIVFASRVAGMEQSAELATSHAEKVLFTALLDEGLPTPDRNHRVIDVDGNPIPSVPDGSWLDARLAVFFDGWYWHGGKQFEDIQKALAKNKDEAKKLQTARKDKSMKDTKWRREIQAAGWMVFTVTEQDMDDRAQFRRVVSQIAAAYKQRVSGETPEPSPPEPKFAF